jgi:hypothetical protein
MIQKLRRAQSIVEYLLVFAAIVLAVLFGANVLGTNARTNFTTSAGLTTNVTNRVAARF